MNKRITILLALIAIISSTTSNAEIKWPKKSLERMHNCGLERKECSTDLWCNMFLEKMADKAEHKLFGKTCAQYKKPQIAFTLLGVKVDVHAIPRALCDTMFKDFKTTLQTTCKDLMHDTDKQLHQYYNEKPKVS